MCIRTELNVLGDWCLWKNVLSLSLSVPQRHLLECYIRQITDQIVFGVLRKSAVGNEEEGACNQSATASVQQYPFE